MDLVDRLEADEQIRQLVARYAVAYDARDLDTLAGIWTPEGRDDAMAAVRGRLLPGRTFHLVATPVITFQSADSAHGTVVVRAEIESGAEWLVVGGVYEDRYVRRGDSWYLSGRVFAAAYSSDVLSRPSSDPS